MSFVDLDILAALAAESWVTCRPFDDFLVWDYTQKTQARKHWTPETRMCRGLVTTHEGEIVSRPFAKFFNLGETPLPPGQPRILEKLDGSLIVVSQYAGVRVVSSRAAMHNPHTRAAEELLGEWMPDEGLTYCFELIHPDMRIVCNYGERRELVLTAVLDTETGDDVPVFAHEWPHLVTQYDLAWPFTPDDYYAENREGFVLHWPTEGVRVKVKFAEYVRLHGLMTGLSPRRLWEMLRDGQSTEALYENVPDEFHTWVRGVEIELWTQYRAIEALAHVFHDQYKHLPRKEYAQMVKGSSYATVMFRLYDGQDITRSIWKLVEVPAGRAYWANETGGGAALAALRGTAS